MSTEDSDPELITAMQLMKLRVKTMGFDQSEKFTTDVLGSVLDVVSETIKSNTTPEPIQKQLREALFIALSKYVDEIFPYKITEVRKFISGLKLLHLNTDEENKQLLEFEAELEQIRQSLQGLKDEFLKSSANTTKQTAQECNSILDRLKKIKNQFQELRENLDKRILDGLSIISQTVSRSRSEELFKLFTQEP